MPEKRWGKKLGSKFKARSEIKRSRTIRSGSADRDRQQRAEQLIVSLLNISHFKADRKSGDVIERFTRHCRVSLDDALRLHKTGEYVQDAKHFKNDDGVSRAQLV